MAHEFSVKDIAFQAGVSVATVDRVLNERPNVRARTRKRVEAAMDELRHQDENSITLGQKLTVDVVMEAPDRFTDEVRAAFELEATTFYPVSFRARFHFSEQTRSRDQIQLLDRICSRKSHGVVLKAPDKSETRAAVNRLVQNGIPVVTLVTDLSGTERLFYAGIHNRSAGKSAAYLMAHNLGQASGSILLTLSSQSFQGEAERATGFREELQRLSPHLKTIMISEGYGRDDSTGALVARALHENPEIIGVYSIGGGNRAILKTFSDLDRQCQCFVAHDLDSDNLDLLQKSQITFVLHHDLKADVRSIFRTIRNHWDRKAKTIVEPASNIQIITPHNIPSGLIRQQR